MKLMLIGGGENGRGNKPYETKEIDSEIVKMTEKDKPVFLFIGLASNFSDSYYDVMKKIYQNLGCDAIYLKKKNIINNPSIVEDKINKADIIYMCGGDTIKLVNELKEYKIDILLKEALDRGCVLSGISAGAIALVKEGLSDYLILNKTSDKYAFISGLSFLDISICPHGQDEQRISDLRELINNNDKIIVLENGTGLKIVDDKYEVITSVKNAKCYLLFKANDIISNKELTKGKIKELGL